MPKRPDTLETTILALELLRRIPRGRKITVVELHEQLWHSGIERDRRTVQRQLEALCEHFDIECDDRNKPYGYSWKVNSGGFSLPALSEQESLLLLLAEEHLRHLLPFGVMKSLQGFFEQAKSKLGSVDRGKPAQQWLKKVRVVSPIQPTLPPKVDQTVFDATSHALYANRWLDVEYTNATGATKSASVMPLGLAQQGVRLYLVCRFAGYEQERILALHRIIVARVTARVFDRPANFDLEKYDAEGHFGFGNGKRTHLRFRTDKETGFHIVESPLNHDQQVVEEEGALVVSATVVETVQLHRWLRGFGARVWDVRFDDLSDAGEVPPAIDSLRHILS